MASVRPEYGPSLITLAKPRFLRLPRPAQAVVVLLAALIVVAVAYKVLHGKDRGLRDAIVRTPVAFSLGYPATMQRVATTGREALHLRTLDSIDTRQSFTVTPTTLPAYRGDPSAGFLIATAKMVPQMRREYPDFVYRGEGRARIAQLPGYRIQFSTKRDGKTVYGRRVLIVPDDQDHPTQALDVTMLSDRSPAVVNVDAVGNNGPIKFAYRSLRFGTERHG